MSKYRRRYEDMSFLSLKPEYFKDETITHSVRVSMLCAKFGEFLKLDEELIEHLALGALLHDFGKLYLPEDVLYNLNKLTEMEKSLIQKHVEFSVLGLQFDKLPTTVLNMILQHHERYDGTGYPIGLQGEDISYEARILTIIDIFDALTNPRAYRKETLTYQEALELMEKDVDLIFDNRLFSLFKRFVSTTLMVD